MNLGESKDFFKRPLYLRMEEEFSKQKYKYITEIIVISFFVFVIAGPIVNIMSNVVDNIGIIRQRLFFDALLGDLQWRDMETALWESFSIAFIAVAVDIVIGFPIAIILTRLNFRGKKLLDTLVDIPMAVPTSALGFSIMLFWSLFGYTPGRILIIFAHIAFTFPYIVRNLKIALDAINPMLEKAALTLSASKLTVFRTITLPLLREGLIAGSILAFTRSLGETGATAICAGLIETAPILVIGLRKQLQLPAASFLSLILIGISLSLLIFIKTMGRRKTSKKEFWQIYPNLETKLSHPALIRVFKMTSFVVMVLLVILPSFFIFTELNPSAIQEDLYGADQKWAYLWIALVNSIKIGFYAVMIDLIFGIPFAFMLTRVKWGKLNALLDTILDIPLSIPSAALGFAIFMFWGPAGLDIAEPGLNMIVFVHITFTFPYMVRPIAATIRNVNVGHEEASATLGASSLTTFRKISLPAIKNGIIAGVIASFTRSLGETGATLVVMGADRTIPVLIVDWVEENAWAGAALASIFVIIFSIVLLLILRLFSPEYKEVIR